MHTPARDGGTGHFRPRQHIFHLNDANHRPILALASLLLPDTEPAKRRFHAKEICHSAVPLV